MDAGSLPGEHIPKRRAEFRLGDSAWFWLALFGTVAVVGLVIVNQKYSQRQMRLELRYQNRVDVQARRRAVQAGQALPEEQKTTPISARAPEPRAGLAPLLALFGLMAALGYIGLAFAWRRHLVEQEQAPPARAPCEYDHVLDR
jgi:hypothetical protein